MSQTENGSKVIGPGSCMNERPALMPGRLKFHDATPPFDPEWSKNLPPIMILQVKKLPNYGDLADPNYVHEGDSGFDLRCAHDDEVTVLPGCRMKIRTGLAFGIPEGHEIQVRPRSGLATKYGITVINSPGTVDREYIGEVQVCLINTSKTTYVVQRGERIAQAVLAPVKQASFMFVDDIKDTSRGTFGFGSTGVN